MIDYRIKVTPEGIERLRRVIDYRIKVTPEGIERLRRVVRQCARHHISIEGLRRVARAGISLKAGLKPIKREEPPKEWLSLREMKRSKRGT